MNTTLTIIELADMINDHLDKGGLVMDAYRNNEGRFPISEAILDEDRNGREDGLLCLRCPDMAKGLMPCIHYTDRLEVHGHEVHYFSGTDYCGKVVFLNPAPVDLTARAAADAAARDAAYAAYAAAVAAAVAAADVARDARDAAYAAADADAAYVAAEVEAEAAYVAMVAARAALK